MGRKFENWIVYFDSCSTLKIEKKRILNFLSYTGAKTLIGFRRNVKWLDGAAIGLLVLARLQNYRRMRTFWRRFGRAYKDLIRTTGMVVYHR